MVLPGKDSCRQCRQETTPPPEHCEIDDLIGYWIGAGTTLVGILSGRWKVEGGRLYVIDRDFAGLLVAPKSSQDLMKPASIVYLEKSITRQKP